MDLLDKLANIDNGPIRLRESKHLSIQLQPIVAPQMFEYFYQNMSIWDKERTTRCVWLFSKPDEILSPQTIDDVIHLETMAKEMINKAENISAEVADVIYQKIEDALKKEAQ